MADDGDVGIFLKLPMEDGSYRAFRDIEEVRDWLISEFEAISKIEEDFALFGVEFTDEYARVILKIRKLISDAEILLKHGHKSNVAQSEFVAQVQEYFLRGSRSATRFLELRFNSVRHDLDDEEILSANEKFSRELGIESAILVNEISNEEPSFENLGTDETGLSELKNLVNRQKEKLDSLVEAVLDYQRETKNIKKQIAEKSNEQNAKIQEIDNTTKAFDQKFKLTKSSEYWDAKKDLHKTRTRWLLGGLGIWGVGFSILLYCSLNAYREATEHANHIYDLTPHLPKNVLLVLAAVWGVRVLVRLILSENHLRTRCEEKSVLIATYLALVKEGAAKTEDKDRLVILGSIFSHTQDGLVQDDGLPVAGPLSALTNLRGQSS